jgi:hypothetical protein
MSLIKRIFQPARPTQQAAAPSAQEHPNFWMYQ